MKYLYGRVIINLAVVEAPDKEEADEIFYYPEETPRKVKETYSLIWTEFPGDNPIAKRDEILAGFLQFMSKIPIEPPPGSLIVTDKTKIDDHES